MKPRTITIGTRGSRLALAQARCIISALRLAHPDRAFRIKVIRTTGDRNSRSPLSELGGVGFFVKEIEEALLGGRCDIAVHSMKDLPLRQPRGLTIAAITERADPFDVLVSRKGEELLDLARNARLGTSSARRAALILTVRPDLRIVPMRGNINTRLKKLGEGACEAIVVAAAALERLGMNGHWTQRLTPPAFLPAPGQGSLALEVRESDREAFDIARTLKHDISATRVKAERSFLKTLGGGCRAAVGGYAELTAGNYLLLKGCVLSQDGQKSVWGESGGPVLTHSDAASIGTRLARELIARGARKLLPIHH